MQYSAPDLFSVALAAPNIGNSAVPKALSATPMRVFGPVFITVYKQPGSTGIVYIGPISKLSPSILGPDMGQGDKIILEHPAGIDLAAHGIIGDANCVNGDGVTVYLMGVGLWQI